VSVDDGGETASGDLTAYAQNAATGWYGPVVVTQRPLIAGAQTYMEANWDDPLSIFWKVLKTDDYIFPLTANATGYKKLGGLNDGLVACDGNSLTGGSGATAGCDYPAVMSDNLAALPFGVWVVENLGDGGETIEDMLTSAPTEVDVLYDATRAHNICVVWEGCNAIGTLGYSGVELEAALETYCLARKAVGWEVVILTVLPFGGATARLTYEPKRVAANALIVANWAGYADALADVAADTDIGEDGDQDNPTYYNVDMWHMTDAGYAIVAGIVQTAVEGLL
jgi:lysophospholipase L1-like esterase